LAALEYQERARSPAGAGDKSLVKKRNTDYFAAKSYEVMRRRAGESKRRACEDLA
jgi:hypothetical protein